MKNILLILLILTSFSFAKVQSEENKQSIQNKIYILIEKYDLLIKEVDNKKLLEKQDSKISNINEKLIDLKEKIADKKHNDEELEKIVNKATKNIVEKQNVLLSNISKKLNDQEWSPSDKATVFIALATIISIIIVYISSSSQLKELKKQNDAQKVQLEINQLENQIFNHINFLDDMLMKREFNMELVDYLMKTFKWDKIEIIENKIRIYEENTWKVDLYKGNFNTYIVFLENFLDKVNSEVSIEDVMSKVTSLDSQINIFAYKLKSLKQILDKSSELGYDELLVKIALDLYYSYAKNLHKYEKIDEDIFSYYEDRINENSKKAS